MIPESKIDDSRTRSQVKNRKHIGEWKKILEEYSVKIYEIDPYFYEHHKEKIKFDKNEREYILFRIDVYFTEYFLAIEIVCRWNKSRFLKQKHNNKK